METARQQLEAYTALAHLRCGHQLEACTKKAQLHQGAAKAPGLVAIGGGEAEGGSVVVLDDD